MPIQLWGECVSTAAYLINRTPSPNLNNCSPYELLYDQAPAYEMMKVFGCLCYAATTPPQRTKFSPRASRCVFLGYPFGCKGYKLFDLDNKVFITSRDVTFREDVFPFATQSYVPPSIFPETVLPQPMPSMIFPIEPHFTPTNTNQPAESAEPVPTPAETLPPPQPNHGNLTQTLPRRSTRVPRPPSHLQDYICNVSYPIQHHLTYDKLSPSYRDYVLNVSSIYEPEFYHQAVKFPEWRQAMSEEIAALEANHTWTLQTLPPGKKTIGCRWLYKVKYKADGTLDRYKAGLVAKGYTQQAGIDFLDTFSPVAKLTTVRVLLSIAAQKHWNMLQLDINNAFLNGELNEEVYMDLPLGYPTEDKQLVCKLTKSLYGLRQASRQWFQKFSTTLIANGFQKCPADHSLFTKGSGLTLVALLVYVDDIVIAGPDAELVAHTQRMLAANFKLKVIGDLKYFLGLEIAKSPKGIHLCQRKYTLQLVSDTGFTSAKPQPLLMDPGIHLNDHDGEPLEDPSCYRRFIGRLMYLTVSRPDITYAVNRLSQFMSKPRTPHLQAMHHLLQYLKASLGQGILFPATSSTKISAYVDADWGSCQVTRRSTTGYCVFMGSSLISWRSKKQATVARSSAEAEYHALAAVTSELLWLKQLLRAFDIPLQTSMVFSDSKSAIQLAHNPTCHERSKHVDIDCHFIREHVQTGFLNLIHVKSQDQLADPLTKALPKPLFQALTSKLGILDIYLPT